MQNIFVLNTAACFAKGRTGGFCLFGSLNSSEKQRLIELRDAEEGALYPCHKKKIKILRVIIFCGLPQPLSCQENDCREALSLKSKSARFYCTHRLYLEPDHISSEPEQSLNKVNRELLGHQDVHGLRKDQSHNFQQFRQRGLLKMTF